NAKVKNLLLVAPANPARFGENGFVRDSQTDYSSYCQQLKLQVPTTLLIRENDPWLSFEDAHILSQAWKINPIKLGAVGHVNVASGFGPFPEIEQYLISENTMPHISKVDDSKYYFRFAFYSLQTMLVPNLFSNFAGYFYSSFSLLRSNHVSAFTSSARILS